MSNQHKPTPSQQAHIQYPDFKKGFAGNYYYVRQILKEKKLKDGRVKLYVSWEGWPESCNSWVYKETVTPVVQFLKNTDSGSFDSIYQSQETLSKKSRKKEEEIEDGRPHNVKVLHKKKSLSKKKVTVKKQQSDKNKSVKHEVHLCTNCRINLAEASIKTDRTSIQQFSNYSASNNSENVRAAKPQPVEKIDYSNSCANRDKILAGKKMSKLSIKSLKKLRRQSTVDQCSIQQAQGRKNNRDIDIDSYRISLGELPSESDEVSKISQASSINCLMRLPFNDSQPKQNRKSTLSPLEKKINKLQKDQAKIQQVVAQEMQNAHKATQQEEPILQMAPAQNENQRKCSQDGNISVQASQNQDQTLLLNNACLLPAIRQDHQQPFSETGTNLLQNLEISFSNHDIKSKFIEGDTSLLLSNLTGNNECQKIDNKLNKSSYEISRNENLLSSSLWQIDEKEVQPSKLKETDKHKITVKNEEMVEESTYNEHTHADQQPGKANHPIPLQRNGQMGGSNFDAEPSVAQSYCSESSQMNTNKNSRILNGTCGPMEMRYRKMYHQLFNSNFSSEEISEKQLQSPRFCQANSSNERAETIIKVQQPETLFEYQLNKSLLYPEDTKQVKKKGKIQAKKQQNSSASWRRRSRQEQGGSEKGGPEQEKSLRQRISPQNTTTILFWQPALKLNQDGSVAGEESSMDKRSSMKAKPNYQSKDKEHSK